MELQTGSRKTVDSRTVDSPTPKSGAGDRPRSRTRTLIDRHARPARSRLRHSENLGLVIIDEQHKFGVAQREQLVRKGRYPHLLVMTATPIPRTLGLTLYGDLDVSVIDELPPAAGSIKTFVRTADKLPKVWEFIREKLAEGRQAYVVYPRVEETDAGSVKAVTKEFENLQRRSRRFASGCCTGGCRRAEKEAVMAAFRATR